MLKLNNLSVSSHTFHNWVKCVKILWEQNKHKVVHKYNFSRVSCSNIIVYGSYWILSKPNPSPEYPSSSTTLMGPVLHPRTVLYPSYHFGDSQTGLNPYGPCLTLHYHPRPWTTRPIQIFINVLDLAGPSQTLQKSPRPSHILLTTLLEHC